MSTRAIVSVLLLGFYLESIYSLKIVPERTTLTYTNKKYFTEISLTVRRSSRRGEYVVNIVASPIISMGNNVTFHVVLYEHSSKYNQYIRTFIEFHYKVCDMINYDKIFGAVIRKQGVTKCPIPPVPISWMNMTLTADFPFEIPFSRGKAEAKMKCEPTNETMVSAELIFSIERAKPKT